MGFTRIGYVGSLPEADAVLPKIGTEVSYVTSEHRLPPSGSVAKAIVGNAIRFSKTNNDAFEKCLYEVKHDIQNLASILGYVKFRTNTAWTQFSPDFTNLFQMTGVYFGLEHGSFNTAVYGFLRNDGATGSLVLGGPMQSYSTVRPGQTEVAGLNWLSMPNGTEFELWFFFNTIGYPVPFPTPNVPIVEVWVRRAGSETAPILFQTIPVSLLGTFKKDTFSNFREGPTDTATFTFGLAGRTGDVLDVVDWAFFPDYRLTVNEGEAVPGCGLDFKPDALSTYKVSDGKRPDEIDAGRWFPTLTGPFIRPPTSLFYPPGKKTTPFALQIDKKNVAASGFEKLEPRMETSQGGMIEAFCYGSQAIRVGDTFGPGISLDDGTSVYRVVFLDVSSVRTVGIAKSDVDLTVAGYYTPTSNIDWTSPKLYRLALDNTRAKVTLFVDEVPVLEVPTSSTFPPSLSGAGRVMFGNLVPVDSRGFSRFTEVNYSPRYHAYEPSDLLLPTAAPYTWSQVGPGAGLATAVVGADGLVITKPDYNLFNSTLRFKHLDEFSETTGFYADFGISVSEYTDTTGHDINDYTMSGVGVNVLFGTKKLQFRLFDAGINGKHIGIIPGSGNIDDLLDQTALGRQFSAPLDWLPSTRYRIVMRGFNSIQVWASTTVQAPLITIPWRGSVDGFDLTPHVAPAAIEFGHLEDGPSSKAAWKYFRYGISNGYDVALTHQYDAQPPDYLFGGRTFVRSEFGT